MILGLTQKIIGSTTDSYAYMYDSLGNITAINRSGYEPLSYTYDAQNQLIKVIEGDFRYEYAYDTYGNLLSVKMYEDAIDEWLSTNTYTYGDSQWLDRLTAFNGHVIIYDEIGNPLTYYNGSDYTFAWNGRELAVAEKGSVTTTYKYGADGLRTQKKVGSTTYNHYYADGLLIRQTWGTNYMDFLYDESNYSCSTSQPIAHTDYTKFQILYKCCIAFIENLFLKKEKIFEHLRDFCQIILMCIQLRR